MATRYLYIDDDALDTLESFASRVKGTQDDFDIGVMRPSDFGHDVTRLFQILSEYDGIILDWRLDMIPDESGKYFSLRAGSLAQEIRTRQTEGVKEIPIVLWSTDPKLTRSYYGDTTSQDLFDRRHDKQEVIDNSQRVREELISLSEGYRKISASIDPDQGLLKTVFNLTDENLEAIPTSLDAHLFSNCRQAAHVYARLILERLISVPGPLISEELLAARLGIDKERSSAWTNLLELLSGETKYTGPFSDGWPRWWAFLVERKWWRSRSPKLPRLNTLAASDRVSKLREITGLENLIAAQPIKDFYSDRYRTICEFYRRPLDPIDGVIIDEKEPMPWQERRYLSIDAALTRRGVGQNIRPHPTETDRLDEIKQSRTQDAEV